MPPIDTADKAAVTAAFRTYYTDSTPKSWSGDVASCNAGTLPDAYRAAVVRRMNLYRAMAGVASDVRESVTLSPSAQAASLMFLANSALSHNPPSTWTCYSTLGATGAGSSNIIIGNSRALLMVDAFISDGGDNNAAAGHRRWLLYGRLQEVGIGETSSTGAMRVLGGAWRTQTPSRPEGTPWPPRGYVPREMHQPSSRWSFSCQTGNFSATAVDMRDASGRLIVSRIESRADGAGEPTIVWSVDMTASPPGQWDPGATSATAETKVTVALSNVAGCGASSYTYTTTIFRAS